ncbi:hypothetical protein AB4Z52_32165 [Rhizobium sp. 2YAF20]|uniref:hypothetical protein n=1 Tax=Rhizobium sp. 2YAF20 TaxID=3233027 RepID=UPI003F95E821
MPAFRISTSAQADILDMLAWTQDKFGELARLRYERLLVTAMRDVAAEPQRIGTIERPDWAIMFAATICGIAENVRGMRAA